MSTLDPAAEAAGEIAAVWWAMLWGSLAVLVLMTGLGLHAARQRSRPASRQRSATVSRVLILGGGLVFPSVVILVLLGYGLRTGHTLRGPPDSTAVPGGTGSSSSQPPFRVDVRAHRWWWEIRYPDAEGGALIDANEIHVPAGRPVELHITSADVIHSVWVPRLGPKMDAIPGITNVLRLQADRPGVYRGQCSEFCGVQHAGMALHLEAHEGDGHRDRLALLAGRAGRTGAASGAAGFAAHCAACHSLDARAVPPVPGPNLAALTARRRLGGDALGNGPEMLRLWLREHQRIKPGNLMPPADHLDESEIEAIASFLEGGLEGGAP